jgi:hypothetical protein
VQQRRPIVNGLSPIDPDSFQKSLLDAVPGVGLIADEAVDRALHGADVLAHYRFPIGHCSAFSLRAWFKKIVE